MDGSWHATMQNDTDMIVQLSWELFARQANHGQIGRTCVRVDRRWQARHPLDRQPPLSHTLFHTLLFHTLCTPVQQSNNGAGAADGVLRHGRRSRCPWRRSCTLVIGSYAAAVTREHRMHATAIHGAVPIAIHHGGGRRHGGAVIQRFGMRRLPLGRRRCRDGGQSGLLGILNVGVGKDQDRPLRVAVISGKAGIIRPPLRPRSRCHRRHGPLGRILHDWWCRPRVVNFPVRCHAIRLQGRVRGGTPW